MSTEKKLELVLSALQIIAVSTSDETTAAYCVRILEEVEDEQGLKMLQAFYNRDLN